MLLKVVNSVWLFFFFQAEDGIRDRDVTGVQTCALPISRNGPSADPASPTPDQMPRAFARSSGSKALFTIETDTVKMIPPPTPCTIRAAMRKRMVGAPAHAAEAPTNRTMPMSAILRRPKMSAKRPMAIIGDTNASRYALTVHRSVAVDASRSSPIRGSATVIPKKSTVSRIITPDIAMTTHHLRFAAVISGTAAQLTMPGPDG